MQKSFTTNNSKETRQLGEMLALELCGGEVLCLEGDLGSGKTTFTQGLLKSLGAKGPYTSPTFVVMKHYKKKFPNKSQAAKSKKAKYRIQDIYHIDAYRVGPADLLELGWEEINACENNVVIVEWADRVKKIIPKKAVWLKFEHLSGDQRRMNIG